MTAFIDQLKETPIEIWVVLGIFLVSLIFAITMKFTKKDITETNNVKLLTFGGMSIALAFILSYIKLFSMPQGGSVTLVSMIPIIFFAFVAGPKAGVLAGIAYGFLQFFQDAFAAHWLSIILDYPLAFAWLGLAGLAPKAIKSMPARFALGLTLAIIGRFTMHVISGAVFFGMYAPEGVNPWIYSITYNIGFLSVEFISTLIVGLFLVTTPIYKTLKVKLAA